MLKPLEIQGNHSFYARQVLGRIRWIENVCVLESSDVLVTNADESSGPVDTESVSLVEAALLQA
jgi:hypothetical protein